MRYKNTKEFVIIRLDEDEEIIGSLCTICKKEKIQSALVSGIGALKKAEIGHYNKEKMYDREKIEGYLEIISLSGNITLLDSKPSAHVHAALGPKNFNIVGGHLFNGIVGPTCEITLIPLGIRIQRKPDKKTKLNLQSF